MTRWMRLALLLCLFAAGILGGLSPVGSEPAAGDLPPWPTELDGVELRQLPLTDDEQRFVANGYPGAIGRFTDGERVYILRLITRPSRRVHSTAECLRSVGWRIVRLDPVEDGAGEHWTRFRAERDGDRRVFEEVLRDGTGRSFPDPSAWYWSAWRGHTTGPWIMITRTSGAD